MADVSGREFAAFIRDLQKKLEAREYAALQELEEKIQERGNQIKEEKNISFENMIVLIWVPKLNKNNGASYTVEVKFTDLVSSSTIAGETETFFDNKVLCDNLITLMKNLKTKPDLFPAFKNQLKTESSFYVGFEIKYPDVDPEEPGEMCTVKVPEPEPPQE